MPNPQLIGQPLRSAPTELKSRPGARRELPEDLLREASQRLSIVSLLLAVLWVIGWGLDHLATRAMAHGGTRWLKVTGEDAIVGAGVLVSFALFFYTRRPDRDPRRVLGLGLGYMWFTALALSALFHWAPVPADWPVMPMLSYIGVVVLMFAAILPSPPGKTLVAALIAVSMNPLSMLVARARGTWEFGSTSDVLLMHYPDYLLVSVAVVISHVMTTLGQQVSKAREMGSYQLGAILGKGGMGEVYQATHRMLARPAAIKLIRPETLGAVDSQAAQLAVTRFRREAEAAASLRSPHTVELYDFGITQDRTLYFVMELLDGMDLETLVRKHGPVPAGRLIFLLRQVCESLEEAHVRGLVHRDIKPANIHVGRLGLHHDFVKVLDFSLVKSVARAEGDDGHSLGTAAGLTPGTPAYMAPEMALGKPADGRADLYAVGCVAYYLLTDQLVFPAANALQMVAKHLQDEPIPPSRRTELEVPAALDRLVLACLAKRPEDRPQSAAELGRALAAIETAPWGEEQAVQWWQVHRPVA